LPDVGPDQLRAFGYAGPLTVDAAAERKTCHFVP
jgi:hypothetical protein